jgi:hypothetical protein
MLDKLEELARKAQTDEWRFYRGSDCTIRAVDLERLVRVARAAKEIARLMALPLRPPVGDSPIARIHHAEYGDEKTAAWTDLRAAISELEKL